MFDPFAPDDARRWAKAAVHDYRNLESPVTDLLVAVLTGVFLAQAVLAVRYTNGDVQALATGLFATRPTVGWVLSPLLHRDALHFVGNLCGIVAVGVPVERHWRSLRYAAFLVVAGYLSIAAGAAAVLAFAPQRIAFYGSSGVTFAASGFALLHLSLAHVGRRPPETVALLFGAAAPLVVAFDLATGPYLGPHWFNGAHLGGFLVGATAGVVDWHGCESGGVLDRDGASKPSG